MIGNPIIITGIPLPSNSPLFLAFIAVHVAAALVCVIAGVVAMLSRKQSGRHPQAGTVYYWSLAVVAATMAILAISRWAEDYHLFILGALLIPRRNDWPNGEAEAVARLGANPYDWDGLLLYPHDNGLLIDNGLHLPLWRKLPQIAFWILPALIGTPILLNSFFRHPLVRKQNSN